MDVSLVEIPEDLVGIRAYVRWENAGMPEDTSPEWQATEYAQARLDLQTEVAQGTTLNDIRRRYNQPVVPGDDEPVVIDFATHARTQNNVVQIHTEPDAKADADKARLSEDAATAAAAAEADLAARVAAAAAATPPPPVERTVEPSAPFAPSIEITKEPAAPAATPPPAADASLSLIHISEPTRPY